MLKISLAHKLKVFHRSTRHTALEVEHVLANTFVPTRWFVDQLIQSLVTRIAFELLHNVVVLRLAKHGNATVSIKLRHTCTHIAWTFATEHVLLVDNGAELLTYGFISCFERVTRVLGVNAIIVYGELSTQEVRTKLTQVHGAVLGRIAVLARDVVVCRLIVGHFFGIHQKSLLFKLTCGLLRVQKDLVRLCAT